MSDTYTQAWERSLADREGFWLDAARAVDWSSPPARGTTRAGSPRHA
jgi:propionyl-CoA synthetase